MELLPPIIPQHIVLSSEQPDEDQVMRRSIDLATNYLIGPVPIYSGLLKLWIQGRCIHSNAYILELAYMNLSNCSHTSDRRLNIAHQFTFEHCMDIFLAVYCALDASYFEMSEGFRRVEHSVRNNILGANDKTFATNFNAIFDNSNYTFNTVQMVATMAGACVDQVILNDGSSLEPWNPNDTESLRTATPGDILSLQGLAGDRRKELFAEAKELSRSLQDSSIEERSEILWELMLLTERVREALRDFSKVQSKRWWEVEHPGEDYVEP